jgi:hypothetical protein
MGFRGAGQQWSGSGLGSGSRAWVFGSSPVLGTVARGSGFLGARRWSGLRSGSGSAGVLGNNARSSRSTFWRRFGSGYRLNPAAGGDEEVVVFENQFGS